MKTLLRIIASTLSMGLLVCTNYASAATTTSTALYPSTNNTTLFGEAQAYDVLLRSNGEAIVNTRITFTNESSNPLSQLTYTVTSGTLGDVSAFQELNCSDLPILQAQNYIAPSTKNTVSPAAPTVSSNYVKTTDFPDCYPAYARAQKDTTNTTQSIAPYYYPSGSIYQKATATKQGNSFTLTLKQPVAANTSGTIVMLYNVTHVSKKQLGIYHYTFKTLQASTAVSSVTVSVSTDNNYYLDGVSTSKVNYHTVATPSTFDSNLTNAANVSSGGAAKVFVSNIGGNGNLIMSASSLAAGETFTVSGRFASNQYLLHWQRFALWLGIGVVFIGLLTAWTIRRHKHRKQHQTESTPTQTPANPEPQPMADNPVIATPAPAIYRTRLFTIQLRALPFYSLAVRIKQHFQNRRIRPMFFAWLCGVTFIVLAAGMSWGYSLLTTANGYSNVNSTVFAVIGILIGIVGVLSFIVFCVVLPVVYAGSLRGSVGIFIHLLAFFIVVAAIGVMVLININHASQSPGCDYYGGGAVLQNAGTGYACPM